MNTTNSPKKNLTNYVKLGNIIYNSVNELNSIDNLNGRYPYDWSNKGQGAFNTLIATGYYQIAYVKDVEMIKTNFDYTGDNKDIVLDFNTECLKKLIQTKLVHDDKDIQGRLI